MSALFGFLLLAGRIAVSEQSFSTATLCDVTNAVGTTGSWAGNSLYEVFVFDCADGTFLSRVDVWGAIWISNLQVGQPSAVTMKQQDSSTRNNYGAYLEYYNRAKSRYAGIDLVVQQLLYSTTI